MVNSHLTVLESSSSTYASATLFRSPQIDPSSGQIKEWRSISYQQFYRDVELFAQYWTNVFTNAQIPKRSIIGHWLSGFTYTDVLHIYGISRAGYIPQLFSLKLSNPSVVHDLLHRAGARALIYDTSFESILKELPLPIYRALTSERLEPGTPVALPDISESQEDDIAFIFHTSGSTSGSPKLVPVTYRWLSTVVKKSRYISKPGNPHRQDVTVCIGSMCHIGQTCMFIGTLQHGSCVIQPTAIGFSSEELIDMISRCGLNRLNQFASFLSVHFQNARKDARLLSMLLRLDDVLYSGLPLSQEDEQWALKIGIKLRNLFGSTEAGAMLLSGGHDRNPSLLQALPGTSYRFAPIDSTKEKVVQQSNARLHELVVLANSPDCPGVLRHADGDFHTGDLFQQVYPGWYIFRGRDDDWIKSESSLRCDTKAIEDNARLMCGSMIVECIVVGTGRPSPVMFIEPAVDMDEYKLKKEIIRKTRHFHSRRYLHERIISFDMIIVVPPNSLPRTATKGNIRRKAVEEAFKTEIDRIFNCRQ